MSTEHSGSGDLNRSMALLWGMHERGTRGPKPGLTLDRVVEAAVRLADTEGLAAVSMRRIAADLGVSAMSLYRYVPGKGELLDLMLDKVSEVTPEHAKAAPRGGWRQSLGFVAHSLWDGYLAHPWLLQVDQARPILGPNALHAFDIWLAGMDGAPLSGREKVMLVSALDAMVSGIARTHVNALQAEARTGVSDKEFWEAQTPALEAAKESGCYPEVFALEEDAFSSTGPEVLDFALERMLDGLELFFAGRRGSSEDERT